MVNNTRPISAEERRILNALILGVDESDRERVTIDVDHARVRPINEDGSIVEFLHENYERPDQGQMPLGYEGSMLDADGVEIRAILYWDRNRRISEFELLRTGMGALRSPQWDSLLLKKP